MTHTKGKMEVGGELEQNYIYVSGWHLGCISSADDCNGKDNFDDDSEAVANARRLAASWNALEGFDIAAIEAGVVNELVEAALCAQSAASDMGITFYQLNEALAKIGGAL